MLLVASLALLLAAVLIAAQMPDRGMVALLLSVSLLAQGMVVATVGFAGLVIRDLSGTTLLVLTFVWPIAAAAALYVRRRTIKLRQRLVIGWRNIRAALDSPPVMLAALLVAGTLAWRTFLALRLPVVDYDGYSYHLVFLDVWFGNNAIVNVPQRPWTAGYPADTELLTTWLAAFTHTDSLTGFTSLLPIPGLMVATTGLARSFGAER